jgi:hypothetical protein
VEKSSTDIGGPANQVKAKKAEELRSPYLREWINSYVTIVGIAKKINFFTGISEGNRK